MEEEAMVQGKRKLYEEFLVADSSNDNNVLCSVNTIAITSGSGMSMARFVQAMLF